MLGRDVVSNFSADCDIHAFSRTDLDITDFRSCEKIFESIGPDVVINCAAYTKVDLCEQEENLAFKVNSEGPKNLASLCRNYNALMVHISTDYVFNGESKRPYKEDSPTAPINIYGKSKLAGEENVRDNCPQHLIIRTSWLFGHNGPNFIDTIIKLASTRDTLQVVDDQHGSPTYTRDLADAIRCLLKVNAIGTFHVTNSGSCSWYDLACFVLNRIGLDKIEVVPVDSSKFIRPARRPMYSVLDGSRLLSFCGHKLRSWQDAVSDYLKHRGDT